MAITTFLVTVSLVAIASASAGFPGWPNNEYSGFTSPLMTLRFAAPPPIPMPQMPGMNFASISQPPLYFYSPFPAFPTMPTIQFPKIPTPEDIIRGAPEKGGTYSGVMLSSQSGIKKNEDGTFTKTGGTTILTNADGDITVKQSGDNPPPIPTASKTKTPPEPNSTKQSFDFDAPKIKPCKPHKFKPFSFNHFDNIGNFKHIMPDMEPIDREKIKNYVPGENEQFVGHSVSSHSSVTNINGVIEEEASLSTLNNDNGLVDENNLAYHKGPE